MSVTDEAVDSVRGRGVAAPSDKLAAIYTRIENGIRWLSEHDEHGAFHFWFESKISPLAPPTSAASPEKRAAYREYHAARTTFERLWLTMTELERREGAST